MSTVKKVMKNIWKKKLIMREEEAEEQFQSSKSCRICEKLIHDDDGKVRYPCHITAT